ncbi:MAG TPA: flagellar hook-associated protein FlgL [Solirubrobacteraceae bacterium]|nr:flagellar hook-associated protein FlgL [Solirubrobacteraceae bacterium]
MTRITTLMTSNQILSEINSSESALSNTEEELSSGLTINQPSDNPYGAALAVQLNGQLSQLNDYNNNITDGQAWTSTATSALNSIQQQVQLAQELVTKAGNGDMSASDLSDIGEEINQIVSSIQSTANAQYDGQYVFSGTSTSTAPYDSSGNYQGSTSMVTRQIGPNANVTVSVNLSDALGTSSTTGLLSTLSNIATQLTTDSGTSALNTTDLTDLQTGLNSLSSLQTQLGATTSQMTMASSTLSDMQTSVTSDLSNDTEANMATTETTYSNEEAAFEAALKAGASIVQSSLMDFLSSN